VDGAIHRAAGDGLLIECRALGGCLTGDAKRTEGHNLPARWVIHAVGPVWRGGGRGEEELLAQCHRRSLELAAEVGAQSIAFPAISTGAYGFPSDRAARIALTSVSDYLEGSAMPGTVDFVLFSDQSLAIWRAVMDTLIEIGR
jgi:O-acetyl-ADP-ribose deacetylase (regulator of RNase III)